MQNHVERLEYGAKIVLYIVAALLPIWFIPWPIGVEFGREVTFTVLIALGAIFWFLSLLTKGEIRYHHSPILYIAAALLALFGLSTIFSKAPSVSMFLADAAAEKFSTLIFGFALMILAGVAFKKREEAIKALMFLLLTATVGGIVSAIQLFFNISIFKYLNILSFAQGVDFNVIGTVNGLALFYAALLIMSIGFLVAGIPLPGGAAGRYLPLIAIFVFLANLVLINFLTSWIIILGSSIFLFGLIFRGMRAGRGKINWQYWVTLGFLVFSIIMVMLRTPFIKGINIPNEVSPSLRATLSIVFPVYKEGVKNIFLGSGPATFGYDWARYKDPAINQTLFWNVRFNQGASFMSTLLATSGILGFLSFLVFLGITLFIFTKTVLFSRGEDAAMPFPALLGLAPLILSFFLYPANFSLILLFFFLAGVLTLLTSNGAGGFLNITEKEIRFEQPWIVFISSLVIIFLLSLGVSALYLEVGKIRSALALQAGFNALNRGNVDEAVSKIERATIADPGNFRNQQILTQARMEKIRNIIQQASQGKNVQQEFQSTVSLAVQNSQRAVELNPQDGALWRTQGALYELIIPFIQGAENFALTSYKKAAELDPLNPELYLDQGRAELALADRIQLLINQSKGQEQQALGETRIKILQEAEQSLQRAIDAKGDYAPAHFLLTQTLLRTGNMDKAIRSAENAKLAAPFDIGVAFQLGLLYYQNNNFVQARSEFERAVAINQNYSNARYFLGLIYDRQGEKARAREEFEKVLAFNPDNQEVQRILSNLRSGKSALEGIAPPGEAPEKRKETPVRR